MPEASRNFIVMGFNYERDVGCMLEDLCHRSERTPSRVYNPLDFWSSTWPPANNWDKYRMFDKVQAGEAACRTTHFAPNSTSDYDWGGGGMRLHHIWWLNHIPKAAGVNPDGKRNNWWKYFLDYSSYAESR